VSTWLYQMSPKVWSPARYRLDIWEGERWAWPVGVMSGEGSKPKPGDLLVTYFTETGGTDPGFYGWAIILDWLDEAGDQLRFRPVAPSDLLKMCPWWNDEASRLADRIRGKMKQRTLWLVQDDLATQLRQGILGWVGHKANDTHVTK
jgi:hypothetical protein